MNPLAERTCCSQALTLQPIRKTGNRLLCVLLIGNTAVNARDANSGGPGGPPGLLGLAIA